jgi:hypothetical protein
MIKQTDTSEKGLEAHITQHLCMVNGFEDSNYFHGHFERENDKSH